MLRNDPPTADPILLIFLSIAVAAMLSFAYAMYAITRPIVLPNAGLADFEVKMQRTAVLPVTAGPADNSERRAIELADHENARQGLQSLASKLAVEERAPTPPVAAAPSPPKVKRVARAPKREPLELHAARASQPMFSPFGSWFR